MKRLLTWLLILAMIGTLAVVPALADDEDEIWGSYVLADMDDGSGEDMTELLAIMASMGMSATLEIAEDGSALLNLFEEEEELIFDFDAMTVTTFNDEGEENVMPFVYEDGLLVFGDDEMSMTFTKGELAAPSSSTGAFDLYTLEAIVDSDGTELELPDDETTLTILDDGTATLEQAGEVMDMTFDFDAMTAEGDGEDMTFELDEDVLSLTDSTGAVLIFSRTDPGYVGSYAIVSMVTEEDGDLTEQLAMLGAMGMAPTLTIEEDGSGVLDLFGIPMELTFDFDAMTFTAVDEETGEEATSPFTYEYGRITMDEEGSHMEFARTMGEGGSSFNLMDIIGEFEEEEPAA